MRFLPGVELARITYQQAVRPILDSELPGLRHSAALLGSGSEVLGYDTERSTDHGWGPRLLLFLGPEDAGRHADRLAGALGRRLPIEVAGWSTSWTRSGADGSWLLEPAAGGAVRHRVEIHDLGAWLTAVLAVDPRQGMTVADWLATPSQLLLEVTAGAVFHDGLGQLEPLRQRLRWYPDDVWRYLLACQWRRIAQEEPFVGRCAEVGDELGSRVVAARLVRDLVRLCLLLERRHAPYSKWLGSAFQQLDCAAAVGGHLDAALDARDHAAREAALCRTYELVAGLHNKLGLTAPVAPTVRRFHDRPFLVLDADRFVAACQRAIVDPQVRALDGHAGAVDQFVDSTDVLSRGPLARRVAMALYGPSTSPSR
jgi:Domain of unknown function (DUF4037)